MKVLWERLTDDSDRPPLITVQGIGTYLTCQRAWWLGDVLGYAPDDESIRASDILIRRKRLAQWLSLIGGVMIAAAALIMVVGLLLGSG